MLNKLVTPEVLHLGRSIHRTEEVAADLDVRIHRLSAVETPTDHTGSVEFIS